MPDRLTLYACWEKARKEFQERPHPIVLLPDDGHIWLDCECGWRADLGATPPPWFAAQKAEMHLFTNHARRA